MIVKCIRSNYGKDYFHKSNKFVKNYTLEKTDGGIKSRKSRQRKPMGNQESKIRTEKADGGIKSRKSRHKQLWGQESERK